MEKSESIAELAKALAKAQGDMGLAKMDTENPAFKRGSIVSRYADLASIVATIKAPLSSNGLAYSQAIAVSEGETLLETILMHVSGEWIASTMPIRPMQNTPQALGSALTYARRYSISSLVGLAASEDDDDDGNAASGQVAEKPKTALQHAPEKPATTAADASPAKGTTGLVDSETVDTIKSLGTRLGYELDALVTKIAADYDGKGIRGLTKGEASGLLDRLQVAVDSKQAKGAKA